MKTIALAATLVAATVVAVPRAEAQTAAQLAQIQAACATSGAACAAAVRTLQAGIAALPPAQRRAAVANIAGALRTQALTAPPAVRQQITQNVSAGLAAAAEATDDPVQAANITQIAEDFSDGNVDEDVETIEVASGSPA
jgi:hypothetical protein